MLSLIDTDEVKSLFTLRAATDEKLTENAGIEKGKQEEGTKERDEQNNSQGLISSSSTFTALLAEYQDR